MVDVSCREKERQGSFRGQGGSCKGFHAGYGGTRGIRGSLMGTLGSTLVLKIFPSLPVNSSMICMKRSIEQPAAKISTRILQACGHSHSTESPGHAAMLRAICRSPSPSNVNSSQMTGTSITMPVELCPIKNRDELDLKSFRVNKTHNSEFAQSPFANQYLTVFTSKAKLSWAYKPSSTNLSSPHPDPLAVRASTPPVQQYYARSAIGSRLST